MSDGQIDVCGKRVAGVTAYADLNRGPIGGLLVFVPAQEAIPIGQLVVFGQGRIVRVAHLYRVDAGAVPGSLDVDFGCAHANALTHIIELIPLIALEHRYDVRRVVAVHGIKVSWTDNSNLATRRIKSSLIFKIG